MWGADETTPDARVAGRARSAAAGLERGTGGNAEWGLDPILRYRVYVVTREMTMESFKVGEVAKQAGVNLQTVHYYERRGLLPRPPRTASNYRAYPADAVLRVRFIKRAQELGFTLKEIQELLSLRAAPRARCADVRARAETKLRNIDEKVRTLQAMRRALVHLVGECSGSGPVTDCPILEALDSEVLA